MRSKYLKNYSDAQHTRSYVALLKLLNKFNVCKFSQSILFEIEYKRALNQMMRDVELEMYVGTASSKLEMYGLDYDLKKKPTSS